MTKKKICLAETVDMMLSEDYVERFRAEYWQTKDRHTKLVKMIDNYMAGKLDFDPSTPIELLVMQANYMDNYLHVLEARAKIEKVRL